jgi:hypothetical protein
MELWPLHLIADGATLPARRALNLPGWLRAERRIMPGGARLPGQFVW